MYYVLIFVVGSFRVVNEMPHGLQMEYVRHIPMKRNNPAQMSDIDPCTLPQVLYVCVITHLLPQNIIAMERTKKLIPNIL